MIRGWAVDGAQRLTIGYEWSKSVQKFEVIFDPTGDFRPGASFAELDLMHSVKKGVFAVGTIFRRKRGGKLYRVAGRRLVEA